MEMFEGGEGSGNRNCINTFMHCCRVTKTAERRYRAMNISQRMLQHAVTRGKTLPLHP